MNEPSFIRPIYELGWFEVTWWIPYYRKLTLVLIKVFEINATQINANWRENYSPIKEINAINTKKHLAVTTGTHLFLSEYKNYEQNRSTGVWGNFVTDNVR